MGRCSGMSCCFCEYPLEEAEYIQCTKSFQGRMPKTEFRITPKGRKALEHYLNHMEALIKAVRKK